MASNMVETEPIKKAKDEPPMTACERVRKFRQSIQDRQRRRFEVCIDVAVIQQMITVAVALKAPVWRVVEHALADYGEEFDALVAEQHHRIVRCANHLQAAAYNQDLKCFNERVSRFLRQRVN
jgi:hypothetical protein